MKKLLFTIIGLLFVQYIYACSAAAGFSNSNTSSGNNLLQITFSNSSSVGTLASTQYAEYIVRFGDGLSSDIGYNADISHNYSAAGTYTATIVALIMDTSGPSVVCGDSITANITVSYPACGSAISVSYGSGGAVTLTANTPAGTSGMTYSWDYGDTNTGTGSPTTHTYPSNGYYTVTLTATSSAPCSWTSTLATTITNSPNNYSCATAHAAFTSIISSNSASFTNTSTNPSSLQGFNINYTWYYGDGTNGTSSSHTYATAGTYMLCLAMHWLDTPSNTQICSDSNCQNITIGSTTTCTSTAGFSHSFDPFDSNLLNEGFYNSSNPGTLSSGHVARYILRYGDGAFDTVLHHEYVMHDYASTGTYTATMIVLILDSPGMTLACSDSTTASIIMNYQPCGTNFTASYGAAGATTFTANTPAGTPGMTYSWHAIFNNFPTSGSIVSYTFPCNGQYLVWVHASNSSCNYNDTQYVYISTVPFTYNCNNAAASFSYTSSFSTANFTNSSIPPGTNCDITSSASWDYGDGNAGTSYSHTYANAGTYTIRLINQYDSANLIPICVDTAIQSVTVGTTLNQITGTLHIDTIGQYLGLVNNPLNPTYKVWLISYNSSTQVLTAIDSMTISGGVAMGTNYAFNNEPADTYRVKAMITNGPSSGTSALPTYGLDSLHWNSATTFYYNGTLVSSGHNINLLNGTVVTGPGFIGGNVTMGANKASKTTGVPDANVEILIRNAAGNIAYAMTDVNGNYSFSNLPVPGTYTVYPEILGYQNTPWIVTLTNSYQTANGINFQTHTVSHYTNTTTGIVNINAVENNIQVYPNPTTGLVNISSNVDAQAVISDVVGHKVFESPINAGLTQLNLSSLQAGMYFISMKSADINYSSKIIIQQ